MTVLGMDTVAGLASADQLENGSREIAALASRLEALLHAFDWTGRDAERVRDSWSTTERPMLDRASQFVAALGAQIRQEAHAQDAASDQTSGAAAAAPVALTVAAADPRAGQIGALVQRAQASGLRGEALQRYADRLGQLTPERIAALDPARFRGADAVQPDGTTCGSSSLVMSRMVNNPGYAMSVLTGYDPVTGQTTGGTPRDRFAAESLAMHERTNAWNDRDGNFNPAWPMGLGTHPNDVAREMSAGGGSGVPGTTYEVDFVRLDDRGASFDSMSSAAQAGHTVPVFVGSPGLPRHVVLVTGAESGALTFYEPGEGRTVTVTREQWLNDSSHLGGWDQPWAIVVPRR
ncbi:hypothetical protein [Nocardioides sp.]|uniref:hypothetical protein n=1 Tax=Nocardioides sp. TaxID=35761 RepID=UPI002C7C43BF|nr:hypothetical protein [Nocardioides sp.]HXH78874.1 hypothetical protein [Nocardioides sp.]